MNIIKPYLFAIGLMCASPLSLASSIDDTIDSTRLKTHANSLTDISCDATAQRCLAVGFVSQNEQIDQVVYSTQDGGDTWSKPVRLYHSVKTPMDSWDNRIMKIRCDDAGMLCHVAGLMRTHTKEYIVTYTTYNGGLTWSKQRFLRKQNSFSHVTGLACSTWGEQCVILGKDDKASGASFVYTTTDMGQTWSKSRALPKSNNTTEHDEAEDISCSDSGLTCTIVGTMDGYIDGSYVVKPISYITTDGGLTWSEPQIFNEKNTTASANAPGVDEFSHIRCNRSGSTCTALRHLEIADGSLLLTVVDAYTTYDSGFTWQKTGSIDNTDGTLYERIHAFDCSNDLQTCVAVHSPAGVKDSQPYTYITHDAGISWAHQELGTPDNRSAFMSVFCDDNATVCQIVGIRSALER